MEKIFLISDMNQSQTLNLTGTLVSCLQTTINKNSHNYNLGGRLVSEALSLAHDPWTHVSS